MKIEIDLVKCCGFENVIELHSKEEYDKLPHSTAGYWREREAIDAGKPRVTGGPVERYYSEPLRYPCILIESGTMNNSDGPNWILTTILYDYRRID